MVGIVVVSHSAGLAAGLAELAAQMAGPEVAIEPAGGRADGGLGTDVALVRDAISRAARDGAGVVVLADLGSAVLSVREVLREEPDGRVEFADAPVVEGAVQAAVIASTGAELGDVLRAAEEARGVCKL
jgi:PTS hybrid protein